MADVTTDPRERLRPLLRTRQFRDFTDTPVEVSLLDAIAETADGLPAL